jgi:predicted enzyme related to lactoylglutathione lyase
MNHLAHFAIHAADVKRAATFYESVFKWKCAGYGDAGVSDEEFVQVFGEGRRPQGAIQSRKFNPVSSDLVGFECSFEVANVDATARAVEAAGGKIVMKKSAIPGVGWIIKFQDLDGNLCCAVTYDRTAR